MRSFHVQYLSIEPRGFGGPTDVHIARQRVHGCANSGEEVIDRPAATVQIREPATALQELDLSLENIDRLRNLAFKGVASWYLPSYLGWRRAIERLGESFTPESCLQSAYRCGST